MANSAASASRLGGLVARHWNLPESIVKGINYHHKPSEGVDNVCYVVYLANETAHVVESESDEERTLPADFEANIAELEISLQGFAKLCAATEERFHQIQSVYD